ncbi:MAG: nucleotidyltransferase domain-containing protein [Anaerolineales bacterium]|uniref:Nucleotidyltransferase domain-containing protein n=1 Tax=Candidatus Desulfolinea nitratireducens TaxID=2841698 RepID=A0A8J6TE75_9CHLR|nr:nucleotidyltransferase domain-containing protein [Candidatus Desulfolinea nitratireducens]MBL6960164.1 nucleotidyltransferase domain-containing protein [Anaerolineales bacterium]
MSKKIQAILNTLKKGLTNIYGTQLKEVYLFGSYARGEANPLNSDIDVLIVLNGEFDYWEESKRSSELIASLSLQYDMVISRKFASVMEYRHSKMPLYINIRKEGIAV